jgi:hypothetical protein
MSNQKLTGDLTSELFSSGAAAVMDRTMSFDVLTGQFAVGPNQPIGRSQGTGCSTYCSSSCGSRAYTRCC